MGSVLRAAPVGMTGGAAARSRSGRDDGRGRALRTAPAGMTPLCHPDRASAASEWRDLPNNSQRPDNPAPRLSRQIPPLRSG